MSNAVPEGWAIQPLNGKVDILSGYPFKSSLFCDDPSKMGIIRIRDLVKQRVETFYAGDFDNLYVVQRGDILIGMDGDFNIVKWKTKSALLNQRICRVKASMSGGFDSDFLFYSLADDLSSIHAATGATTVKHLSVKDIKGIEKVYPPLPEQQKIATILSSVDDVIEKTRAQIDKLKDLKTGMMQELLTKGIGHTEFKDSPVGRIPISWAIKLVGEMFHIQLGKMLSKASKTDAPVYHYLGNKNVQWGTVDLRNLETMNFTDKERKKFSLLKGDLLVCEGGDVGRSAIWNDERADCYYQKAIHRLRVVKGEYAPRLLLEYMRFAKERGLLTEFISRTSIAHLTKEKLCLIPVPVPPLSEQERIIDLSTSLDSKIQATRDKLSQLIALKKALMQDLLTGKVRVNVDNKESAAA